MVPRLRDRLLRRYISAPDHRSKYRLVRWLGQDLGYSLRDLHGRPVEKPDAVLAERNLVAVLKGCEAW